VVVKKPWYMLGGCGLSLIKTRASAVDSIQTAAAWMQHIINQDILIKKHTILPEPAQTFALITYLCGASFGSKYLQNGQKLKGIHACRGHHIPQLIQNIRKDQKFFHTLASTEITQSTHSHNL